MSALQAVVAEVESHVAEAGWDQAPQLFALVDTEELLRAEPQLATTMGIVAGQPGSLTPVAQDALADLPLDEALARITFGEAVLGVVIAHEVLVLPPSAEAELAGLDELDPATVAAHPQARDVRMVVGVVRDGTRAAVLRLRAPAAVAAPAVDTAPAADAAAAADTGGPGTDELLSGPDLAPALAEALLATLSWPGRAEPAG